MFIASRLFLEKMKRMHSTCPEAEPPSKRSVEFKTFLKWKQELVLSQSHSWMTGTSGLRTERITLDLQTYYYAMNCPMKIFYVQTNLANVRPKMILVRHLTWQMKTVIFSSVYDTFEYLPFSILTPSCSST